jgi:hypothetical protein
LFFRFSWQGGARAAPAPQGPVAHGQGQKQVFERAQRGEREEQAGAGGFGAVGRGGQRDRGEPGGQRQACGNRGVKLHAQARLAEIAFQVGQVLRQDVGAHVGHAQENGDLGAGRMASSSAKAMAPTWLGASRLIHRSPPALSARATSCQASAATAWAKRGQPRAPGGQASRRGP